MRPMVDRTLRPSSAYRVWLRYELFRGQLSDAGFQASETDLINFIKARGNTKPHLNV